MKPAQPGSSANPVQDVRILPGCILCGRCEEICPQVFSMQMTTSILRSSAERHYGTHAAKIALAARECPARVIRVRHAGPNPP